MPSCVMTDIGIMPVVVGCSQARASMEIETWTMRFGSEPISRLKRWLRKQRNWLLCRHKVDTLEIEDLDLVEIRAWILSNVDQPLDNMSVRLMMLQDRYVLGGEFRFRRQSDAVAFRLRWCE